MKINYCLPIIKDSKEKVLLEISQNVANYDFFEVWLDYIVDLDEDFLKALVEKYQDKLIVLFRRQNLEDIKLPIEKRIALAKLLENSNCFLDLDINIQQEELDYIQKNNLNIPLILSFHDYEKTPDDGKLQEIVDKISIYSPKVLKIATMCNSQKDALRLLQLLLNLKEKNLEYIVLGMGEHGNITRIFGTIWGNKMIFAPNKESESSAPGQLTREELESIFNILKGQYAR